MHDNEIIEGLKENPRQLLCIAAGHTSLGVFKCLVRAFNEGYADFSLASFLPSFNECSNSNCRITHLLELPFKKHPSLCSVN